MAVCQLLDDEMSMDVWGKVCIPARSELAH